MRSSGAAGSFRARGYLHTGVTRGLTLTRVDAGSRKRPLSRSRSPFRRRRGGGEGRFARATGGWGAPPGGIIGGRWPT